jgi:hypothetical protein
MLGRFLAVYRIIEANVQRLPDMNTDLISEEHIVISYLFFKYFIASSRYDSWSWVPQSPQTQILVPKIFKRMIKAKIDYRSHLIILQRDFDADLDQDIAEIVMGILYFFVIHFLSCSQSHLQFFLLHGHPTYGSRI